LIRSIAHNTASSALIFRVHHCAPSLAALLPYRANTANVAAVQLVSHQVDTHAFVASLLRQAFNLTGTAVIVITLEVCTMPIAALMRISAAPAAFATVLVVELGVDAFSMASSAVTVALALSIDAPFILIAVAIIRTRSVLILADFVIRMTRIFAAEISPLHV
jgi:hypothetical protein